MEKQNKKSLKRQLRREMSGLLFAAPWLIGFIAGYILIRILIRRTIAKRGLWKYIISILFNAFLSAMFVIVCAILYAIWKPSIAISSILIIFLIEFFGLVEAFFNSAIGGTEKRRDLFQAHVKTIERAIPTSVSQLDNDSAYVDSKEVIRIIEESGVAAPVIRVKEQTQEVLKKGKGNENKKLLKTYLL